MADHITVGVVPYTCGHQSWNVEAMSPSMTPGVYVTTPRLGSLR
jgi:hypothetical protein